MVFLGSALRDPNAWSGSLCGFTIQRSEGDHASRVGKSVRAVASIRGCRRGHLAVPRVARGAPQAQRLPHNGVQYRSSPNSCLFGAPAGTRVGALEALCSANPRNWCAIHPTFACPVRPSAVART